MKLGSLASRVDRLEQQVDPKPGVIIVCARDGETEAAAMERAIVEHRVKHNYPVLIFCNELDAAS